MQCKQGQWWKFELCDTSVTSKASKAKWWQFELCDTSATSKAKWWNFKQLAESLVWYPGKIIGLNSYQLLASQTGNSGIGPHHAWVTPTHTTFQSNSFLWKTCLIKEGSLILIEVAEKNMFLKTKDKTFTASTLYESCVLLHFVSIVCHNWYSTRGFVEFYIA